MKFNFTLISLILTLIFVCEISCSNCEDDNIVFVLPLFQTSSCELTNDSKENKDCTDRQMLISLYGQLEYPEQARENQIEGNVWVEFDIGKDGTPFNHEVVSGIGYGCDEEALRVVETFHFIPAKNECGNKIVSHMGINVKFSL